MDIRLPRRHVQNVLSIFRHVFLKYAGLPVDDTIFRNIESELESYLLDYFEAQGDMWFFDGLKNSIPLFVRQIDPRVPKKKSVTFTIVAEV